MNKPRSAIILGGAMSVFEDYEAAKKLTEFDVVIAVNNVLSEVAEVNHFVSMHPAKVTQWLEARRANGHPEIDGSYWTSRDRAVQAPAGMTFQTVRNTRGGSGLLAIEVARYLNCMKIVLAGIPMTINGEHYHTPGKWKECKLYRIVWEANASLKVDVRSMSGWTKDQFGEPNEDWLMI